MSLETPTSLPKRRHPRLPAGAYAQPGAICSITMAVQGRRPVFAIPEVATAAASLVRELAEATGVRVYAFCIMPDHVHLVIAASPTCDILTFVARFKNLAQRAAWAHGVQGSFWQKSFWDHFLRAEEDVKQVVEYVLDNPVRRGLAPEWRQYPYGGSLVFDL